MKTLFRNFILAALLLIAVSAHAQTRTLVAEGGFSGFGAQSPINGGSSDFLYRYVINYPGCWSLAAIGAGNAPWNPNSIGVTDYALSSICTNGSNAGPGVYTQIPYPIRIWDTVQYVRLDANVTTSTFWQRINDCTTTANTGVFRGCIDYNALSFNTSNQITSTTISGNSSALMISQWYVIEHCFAFGVNGSGTIPTAEKIWVGNTPAFSGTPGTTSVHGGGTGFTFDNELGAPGSISFGPWKIFSMDTGCPASAYNGGAFFYSAEQATANATPLQMTASTGPNWQNAAAASPGAAGYNYDATAGDKDIYLSNPGTYSAGQIDSINLRASVEQDAEGARVPVLYFSDGTTATQCPTSTGFTIGNFSLSPPVLVTPLQNGTYQQMECLITTNPGGGSITTGNTKRTGVGPQ